MIEQATKQTAMCIAFAKDLKNEGVDRETAAFELASLIMSYATVLNKPEFRRLSLDNDLLEACVEKAWQV